MNRASKALLRWKSELWETQFFPATRNRTAERRYFKRKASKARRALDKAEQCSFAQAMMLHE